MSCGGVQGQGLKSVWKGCFSLHCFSDPFHCGAWLGQVCIQAFRGFAEAPGVRSDFVRPGILHLPFCPSALLASYSAFDQILLRQVLRSPGQAFRSYSSSVAAAAGLSCESGCPIEALGDKARTYHQSQKQNPLFLHLHTTLPTARPSRIRRSSSAWHNRNGLLSSVFLAMSPILQPMQTTSTKPMLYKDCFSEAPRRVFVRACMLSSL